VTMNRISAFISYSSAEKKIGGRFKSCLTTYCGYETFIAHDDIPGSSVWETELLKAISQTDFFIPLISKSFKNSPYSDQETGIAVYLNKKIIPIKLESVDPYGFISKYQALQYKATPTIYFSPDNVKELVLTIAQIGLSFQPRSTYRQKALNSVVHAFCQSNSFDTANATIQVILRCKDLSPDHVKEMKQAIKENGQIQGAFDLSVLKEFLLKTYNFSVD